MQVARLLFYQDFPSLPKRNPFTISCHPAKLTIPAEAFRAKYWVVVLFLFFFFPNQMVQQLQKKRVKTKGEKKPWLPVIKDR